MTTNPWQKRFRRLATLVGTVSSLYLLLNYTLDRMREARIRALKDRQIKDRLKSHFTTLLSTISFTLYALLPTLQTQLSDRYPIEQTSQALQDMSLSSSAASIQPEHPGPDEGGNSLHLNRGDSAEGASVSGETDSQTGTGVGESWASEFQRRDGPSEEAGERIEISPATSQSISLPTDISSETTSPPSNLSSSVMLSPSPPRHSPPVPHKSKKELWKDLKIQSIAKSLTTAYLVPLLLILTSSQLSTLARVKYLNDIKTSLPGPHRRDVLDEDDAPAPKKQEPKSGWLNYFSVEAMGLAEYAEPSTSSSPFNFVSRLVPAFLQPAAQNASLEIFDQDEEEDRAEAERMFLTYSWWLLHEGWQGVADRVDDAVERVFANMPLKRGLSVEDWHSVIREVRAIVETDDGTQLHDFTNHILPPLPLNTIPLHCPLPTHPETSPYLMRLLDQTRQQLASADGRHLLDRGVSQMVKSLCQSLNQELYAPNGLEGPPSRRLVDCLPEFNRWAKGVWEGIPDSGVEGLVSLPEYESYAALIFGDWA